MNVQIQNISGGYGKKMICKNISFAINKGEVVCVVGPNGSGKTTLIKLILGLIKKANGEVVINNRALDTYSVRDAAKLIAYVPQQHSLQFSLSVFDVVLMGRTSYIPSFSFPSYNDEAYALTILETLQLSSIASMPFNTLSGGQKQMVLIARALCQNPQILVMDEPTSSLDYYNQSLVIKTIQNLSKQGFSILVTSHNLSQPFLYAHQALLLKEGSSYAFGKIRDVITKESLTQIFGIDMDVLSTNDSNGLTRTFCVPL